MCSNQETVVRRLKTAREAAGLSQRALSAMTGLRQGQLSKIEAGLVDPRLSSVLEMARALELEPVLSRGRLRTNAELLVQHHAP